MNGRDDSSQYRKKDVAWSSQADLSDGLLHCRACSLVSAGPRLLNHQIRSDQGGICVCCAVLCGPR